jgi:hypothetical protein
MLTTGRNYHLDYQDDLDFIHNYYERLVIEAIAEQSERVQQGDRDFLADVACVALNRLPPRYIRHDVDMTFFMSPQDIQEIGEKVAQAVRDALNYVESRERGEDPKLPTVEVSLAGNRATKSAKTAKGPAEGNNEKSKPAKGKSGKKKS